MQRSRPSQTARRAAPLILGLLALAGCKAPLLSVDDAVVLPGEKTRLIACVEREPVLGLCKDVEQVRVHFDVDESEVGAAKTDEDGVAEVKHKLLPGTENYEARVLVDGRELRALGRVFTWDKDRVIIVVDIDHTIEQTNYKGLLRSPNSEDDSDPIKHSVETLKALAQDFQIVYLTGRPRFLIDKTRMWLRQEGFPTGPVITSVRVRDMVNPGEFKRRKLHELRKYWPNLLIGIGNQPGDADAYGANGMLALVLPSKPEQTFGPHAVVFRDWKQVGKFFGTNRAMLTDADALHEVIEGEESLLLPVPTFKKR
jgi:hypothetical protein